MAHFYGSVQGQSKTKASRLGSRNSDLVTVAASWEGAVSTRLYYNEKHRMDYATVSLVPWHGRGITQVLYDGPVGGPLDNITQVL